MRTVSRVLVLDDDGDFREVLGEMLIALGVTSCVTVGSFAELQRREQDALASDLAILDINLGPAQPSGIEACRWLIGRGFAGRAVFLTGHAASHPLVAEAARSVRAPVLEKPLEMSALAELVVAQERA